VTGSDIERKVARVLKPIGSGIFMPLFSLPSYLGAKKSGQLEYGMGDSGPAAREFVKSLQSIGQKFWMLLPIGPTDQGNCPYRTDSSFAINLNIISPEDLLSDGWITRKELDSTLPTFEDLGNVALGDEAVFAYKRKLLAFAFKRRRQKKQASWQEAYESFVREQAGWLDLYALYKTIEAHYPIRWTGWPEALRDADPVALEQFADKQSEAIEQEKFYQFLAQHYFLQLRRFAEEHGIYMIGDMPAYSMHGSADVWACRRAFELTEKGERTRVAGAPPDVFDAQGQGWNHPMYRWDDLATLEFLKRKYLRMKQLFAEGFVRDDHIIGKVTPWGYTFGQPPAQGHRVTGTFLGNSLFDAVLDEIPDLSTFLIGEDLGILTAEAQRVMQHYQFMGMKVLQFMPFNDGPGAIAGNMYTPGNYAEGNVMLLGTHDAPIIREWWRKALNDAGRYHFSEYLQQQLETTCRVTDETIAALFTELAMKQAPHMMLHQMPDIIVNQDGSSGLVDARMNDPGNHQDPAKNWSWRLLPDAFGKQTMVNLKKLTELTNRTPEKAMRRLKPCWPADAVSLLSANILRKTVKASKALVQQLESIVSKGQVRYAPLGTDCLSAVYQHSDGEQYLLLSTDCATLEQQAVSLIRGLEAYVQQGSPNRKTPLKGIEDAVLIDSARAAIDETDQSLRWFALLGSDVLREAMITFMGSLFDLSGTIDETIRERLQAIGLSADESRQLGHQFKSVWTDLWVTYEQRGTSRRNIIRGILTGELEGARVSLRELRWRLTKAYAEKLSAVEETVKQWEQSVARWAKSLDMEAVKRCLFGTPDQPFFHDLDTYGKAEGLSDLLGLMRKANRKEQNLGDSFNRFHEYALSVIRSLGHQKSRDKKEMVSLLMDAKDGGSFELLLELIERCLITKLSELKPSPSLVTPEFPAGIDLQIHSYHSDCGGQSVVRIVYEAYDRGLKTIAITDHQCFDGIEQALEIGNMLGVQIIPAIELYTGIRRGECVEQRRDILVYFPDVPGFLNRWKQGLDAETWQLFNDGWNRKLNGSEWGDVPIRRVTEWARAHGGVSVLAHPGLWSSEQFHEDGWSFDAFEQLFLETGLAGIEISHSRLPFKENTKRFVPLVEQFNQQHPDNPIVFTTGTDSHTSEGIGRANLTEAAVTFIAHAFAPEEPAAPALRNIIVDRLQGAAQRIADRAPLYQLRDEVLRDAYAGLQAYDRPLAVRRTDIDGPSDTILAGIKEYNGQPVIVAANTGRREQFAGKDWGSLNLAESSILQNDPETVYRFEDLMTGEHYERTGAELVNDGLHVGLLPHEVQFLLFSAKT
jgi:4-alpha-glucanotransferase